MDCILFEIFKIVEMCESVVKNRFYRVLEKFKKELKEWGGVMIMFI